jgi:4'-phosphopantetheinyl transferase
MSRVTPKTIKQIPELKTNDVHVWQIDLSGEYKKCGSYKEILSADEVQKVERFKSIQLRTRALAMRVQLRQLLSVYLKIDPALLEFKITEFGKPYIVDATLSFNVSHSNDSALVAISLGNKLGVDIEHWRYLDNLEGLVERNFSESEKAQWKDVADTQREAIFFDIWTCKEAFIKATGRGLGIGVARCEFNLHAPYALKQCPNEYGDASEWVCVPLRIKDRVSASIITRADACKTSVYDFDSEKLPQMS